MDRITAIDHIDTGVGRLSDKLTQDNIEALLTAVLTKTQELEDEFIILAEQKDIDIASGIWLDYLGRILAISRNGVSDESYRESLRQQISVRNSDGTPNDVIALVLDFTDSTSVRITEYPIAFGSLIFDGQSRVNSNLYEMVEDITPVGTRWILKSDFFSDAFLFAYEVTEETKDTFQTTDDGSTYEDFEVTSDGSSYGTLYTLSQAITYYSKSVVEGRNSLPYEEPDVFRVTSDGSSYEILEVEGTDLDNTNMRVNTPYVSTYYNELPLHWEVDGDSVTTTGNYNLTVVDSSWGSLSVGGDYFVTTTDTQFLPDTTELDVGDMLRITKSNGITCTYQVYYPDDETITYDGTTFDTLVTHSLDAPLVFTYNGDYWEVANDQ